MVAQVDVRDLMGLAAAVVVWQELVGRDQRRVHKEEDKERLPR
jgi:hypothetical protein